MDDNQAAEPIPETPQIDASDLRLEYHLASATAMQEPPSETPPKRSSGSSPDAIEEIAEDMLDVIQRLGSVEQQVQQAVVVIASVNQAISDQSAYQHRLVEALRRDLLAERRAISYRFLFEPMVSALDSLEMIGRGFDPARDQRSYGQTQAAIGTLANLLQAIGFVRFEVQPGDRFDPARMQCLGYAEGEPGLVLQVLQPGYIGAGAVIRPAGVLIADPAPKAVIDSVEPASTRGDSL